MKKLILKPSGGERPVNPLSIFNKLTLRGGIENIWEPQADALKVWHSNHRSDNDVVLQMNTGGGKTLVGLLMAQSLTNETKGNVVYVCPNTQLVEQTQSRAEEIGLSPAIRHSGTWHNQTDFDTGKTFCLTNYHSVFTGHSTFFQSPIDAIIFDDAHVANGIIRSCFTVRIKRESEAFKSVIGILRPHFANSSKSTQIDDITNDKYTSVVFTPMYLVHQRAAEIRAALIKCGIDEDRETLFAWQHIQNNISHCCILLSNTAIEIAPATVPLSSLPYFTDDLRRIYLTATLPSQTAFAKTFGVTDPTIIKPTGKSGDAQRLFVFTQGKDADEQRESAKTLVQEHKSCVISPSDYKAKQWVPPSKIYDKNSGQTEIERFKKSSKPEMLGLVARYDGIDLPGKSCRVLILDQLPKGESLYDRFIDEGLKVESIRLSNTATRVTQAIGRIFRSNTDHGVVILVGPDLQTWLRSVRHQRYLPELLQKQIQLSTELHKSVNEGEATWPVLMDGVLDGHENWDATYTAYIDEFSSDSVELDANWYLQAILLERKAYEYLWDGHPAKAADLYSQIIDDSAQHDMRVASWYRHLKGTCLLSANSRIPAYHDFVQAANVRAELGRPSHEIEQAFLPKQAKSAGNQAVKLAAWYVKNKTAIQKTLSRIDNDLKYGEETNKAEEALKLLGDVLGVESSRPDKDLGLGPDVVWVGHDAASAWGFELKTGKTVDGKYKKIEDIGQCHNHKEWMLENFGRNVTVSIIGRLLPVSDKASPASDLQIIEIDAMRDLYMRTTQLFATIDSADKSNLPLVFQTWLEFFGLNWPQCVNSLASRLAVDLRGTE